MVRGYDKDGEKGRSMQGIKGIEEQRGEEKSQLFFSGLERLPWCM
jgi:hypothetical protein